MRSFLLSRLAVCLCLVTSLQAETWTLQEAATAVAKRFMADNPQPKRTYMADLTLEALLDFDSPPAQASQPHALVYQPYVLNALKSRGWTSETVVPWQQQPFSCLTFALYRKTEGKAWLTSFIDQSAREKAEVHRSPEGAILHPRGEKRGGGQAWLIDALQEYASRMAKTGSVTQDASYFCRMRPPVAALPRACPRSQVRPLDSGHRLDQRRAGSPLARRMVAWTWLGDPGHGGVAPLPAA